MAITHGPRREAARRSHYRTGKLTAIITAQADVNANGYAITDSAGGIVTAAAKSAEGQMLLTLNKTYPTLLASSVSVIAVGYHGYVSADAVAAAANAVTISFRAFSNMPVLVDPDGLVILVELAIHDSSTPS